MACSADWQAAAAAQIGKQWAWLGSRAGLGFGLGLALGLGSRGGGQRGAWLGLGLGLALAWLGVFGLVLLGSAFICFIGFHWLVVKFILLYQVMAADPCEDSGVYQKVLID